MIIIGEKINGSIPSVAKAIAERDADWIRNLAKVQTEAGADFIDVCASVKDDEVEVMHWLIDLVQEVTDTPISVDSPNAECLVELLRGSLPQRHVMGVFQLCLCPLENTQAIITHTFFHLSWGFDHTAWSVYRFFH